MTTQTQTSTALSVDEAFWELVWSDPDLLAADLRDLADDLQPPPPDRIPPGDDPAEAPRPPGPPAPDASARRPPGSRPLPAAARGKVRSPPAPSNHSC